MTITPKAATLQRGETQQLTGQVRDGDGNVMNVPITWTSSDPEVVTVSATGLVTAVGPGNGSIVASADNGARISASFSVLGIVATVQIEGSTAPLSVTAVRQLTASLLNAAGVPVTGPITWTSSAPGIISVNAAGVIRAIAEGTATITATSGTASASRTVQAAFLVSTLTLAPNPLIVARGATGTIVPTARDGAGNVLANRPFVWTTNNAGAGSVSAAGVVTVGAAQFGSATITGSTTDAGGTTTATTLLNPLRSGVTVTGLEGRGGAGNAALTDFYVYYVNVPAGTTALNFTLSGGTGDPDLYVDNPSGANRCTSEAGAGATETCAITTTLTAGIWRVRVEGWSNFAGWTLATTITPTP